MYQQDDDDAEDYGGAPMQVATSTVSEMATSFFFAIQGLHSIQCNSQPKRVTVMQGDLAGEFRYIAVPKVMPHAYLRVKAPNTLGCPLLAGEVNVFMDNNYVTTSNTKAVPMGEDLFVSLGVDDGVVVKHKLLKRFKSDHGSLMTGKKVRVTYEYLITLKNCKSGPEDVVVLDQIPLSQDGTIVVTLVEPIPDGKIMKHNEEDGKLEWKYKLAAGEAVSIKLCFHVQHNAGDSVDLP
jgi:uncharacterized protein (TIGR02231 family)